MKKAMVLVLALALCFSAASVFAAPPKVGMCIYKFDDTFMSYVRNQIETLAKGNLDLSTQDSQYDQPKQNDQIDQFLTQGVKALAINMVDPSAANVLIDKAAKKKVPLVLFNREPGDLDLAKYPNVFYVGAKAQESGTMEGQIVAKYWKAHPEADLNKDGVLDYVMLIGDPSNTDAKYRTQFSIEAVQAAGIKVNKVAEDTAMWDRPKAQEKVAAWLTAYPGKIEVIFANNDDMALGAIEACKAAGYFKGGKYMPVVGVDATPPALDGGPHASQPGCCPCDRRLHRRRTWNRLAEGHTVVESASAQPALLFHRHLPDINDHRRAAESRCPQAHEGEKEIAQGRRCAGVAWARPTRVYSLFRGGH